MANLMNVSEAIEEAAKELPENTHINICVEAGYGGVDAFYNGFDIEIDDDISDMDIAESILYAIDKLKTISQQVKGCVLNDNPMLDPENAMKDLYGNRN